MGNSCTTLKGHEQDERAQGGKPRKEFLRMAPAHKPVTRSQARRHGHIFASPEDYDEALQRLRKEEDDVAFDAKVRREASGLEDRAVAIIRRMKLHDSNHKYGAFDARHHPNGRRAPGQHFLGNVEIINRTLLMKVAKRMPKGAHLHIHFNSCLPAIFLIKQARDIHAMYIRTTLPLTSCRNMADARVSFMVLTDDNAKRENAENNGGKEVSGDHANVWSSSYVPNTWMRYKKFQRTFRDFDSEGTVNFEETKNEQVLREGESSRAETWLEHKMLFTEEEAHGINQTSRGIWERFNHRTQMMKGLFCYESAYRNYTRACILDFVDDNIQYAEIRPNFMSTNSLRSDDGKVQMTNEQIVQVLGEELKKTMKEIREVKDKYFGGMKVIYCTPRSFQREQVAVCLQECIELKKKYGELICGFDLVGHEEMGQQLRDFVPEFLDFQKSCRDEKVDIPFLFHCGETLGVGDKVDGNLYDAILLNSKRIGHGYSIAHHPHLMEIFKEKNIAVEACPISNEILGLTSIIAGHHLPILLANNVPCTINSDNATFYKSSLSHDFYQVMIGSESMDLLGWKQLAIWSLEHSCMSEQLRETVTAKWKEQWYTFCEWIVDTYGSEEWASDAKPLST